jgi:hypothetical protein
LATEELAGPPQQQLTTVQATAGLEHQVHLEALLLLAELAELHLTLARHSEAIHLCGRMLQQDILCLRHLFLVARGHQLVLDLLDIEMRLAAGLVVLAGTGTAPALGPMQQQRLAVKERVFLGIYGGTVLMQTLAVAEETLALGTDQQLHQRQDLRERLGLVGVVAERQIKAQEH